MNIVNPRPITASVSNFSESKTLILNDIRAKWVKFSEDELGALESNDDLVAQIVEKYNLDKVQASRDVDTVLNGRQI